MEGFAFIFGILFYIENSKHENMPFHATIHNEKLYGYFNSIPFFPQPFPLSGDGKYDLVEISKAEKEKITRGSFAIPFSGSLYIQEPNRYNISNGCFWFKNVYLLEIGRIPQKELQWFLLPYEGRNRAIRRDVFNRALSQLIIKYPKASKLLPGFPCYNFSIDDDFRGTTTKAKTIDPPYDPPYSDLLPTGPTCIRSFRLYEKKEIKTWTHRGTWKAKEESWEVLQRRIPDENFPSAFLENFYVFGRAEDYYFVTSSGRLFLAKKTAPGKTRQMRALWDEPKRPITAILEDTDAGRTWLVAREKGQQTPVAWFLELKENPKTEMFSLRDLPAFEASEPLRTILQYDFIRRNAKVLQKKD